MAKKGKIYRCEICGNIVETLEEGAGTLVCCGQDMNLLDEKTQDEGLEKHVPKVKVDGEKITVKVGDIAHPMEDTHYIQFIELLVDDSRYIHFLKPGEKPEAIFTVKQKYNSLSAREYCNIHKLWSSK